MSDKHPTRDELISLAHKAGSMIVNGFRSHSITHKSDGTPITEVDQSINDMVVANLNNNYQELSIIGEEGSVAKETEYSVFFDPIDGTKSYAWQMPIATFCISVLQNREPILAVAYDPFSEETYYAERGNGAWMSRKDLSEDIKLTVADRKELGIGTSIAFFHSGSQTPDTWALSADLSKQKITTCYIPSQVFVTLRIPMGLMHASVSRGKKGWETACLSLLVGEAGGVATDINGNKLAYGPNAEINGHIFACTTEIHSQLFERIQMLQANKPKLSKNKEKKAD